MRNGIAFLPVILSFQTLQLAGTLFIATFPACADGPLRGREQNRHAGLLGHRRSSSSHGGRCGVT